MLKLMTMEARKMAPLLFFLLLNFSATSYGQFFPSTDGSNDLFAVLTYCNIRPRYPPRNEVACYRTNIRTFNGISFCSSRLAIRRNISISTQTQNYTIFFAHTPGRLRERLYSNRLLCRWNIGCPSNQLMYLDVAQHNIEPAVNSTFFRNPVCLDYLRVSRDFGSERTCGASSPMEGLEPNRVLLEFRSNRGGRFPGFKLRVVCFNPIQQDGAGCRLTGPRGRRSAEQTTNDIPATPPHNVRPIRYAGRRFFQKPIPKGAVVLYNRREVTVMVNGNMLLWVTEINDFNTFNEFDGVTSFGVYDKPQKFRGFGVLTVIEDSANYVIYGVDEKFMPNNEEMEAIRTLLDAEEDMVRDEDFTVEEEPASPSQMPPNMNSRQNNMVSGTRQRDRRQIISPGVMNMASELSNSCNAVLRSVAESILAQ